MSVTTPAPEGTGGEPRASAMAPAANAPGESCPLCGSALHSTQDWCLNCGAAARTRLASPPRWKPLLVALATVICLSLGVLAAALVALAGGGESRPASTRTLAVAPLPATTQPSTAVGGGGVAAPTTTGGATSRAKTRTSTPPAAGSSQATRERLDRVLGKGANGTKSTPRVKLPAVKIPQGTAQEIKIPKIKVPEIKLPKLTLPEPAR